MNHYIILCRTISNIGGAELYLSSKIKYLEDNGWECHIFFHDKPSDIRIQNFEKFRNNWIPNLLIPVGNISHDKLLKVYPLFESFRKGHDDVIIESLTLTCATWGEYMASKLGAKHFIYYIDEQLSSLMPQMRSFVDYKISQNLFFCIKEEVIADLVKSPNLYVLPAIGCSDNIVCDIPDDTNYRIKDNEFVILSLGRLEKPYISHMIDMVCEFAQENDRLPIHFIIIGDTHNDGIRRAIFSKLKQRKNIIIHHTGYLWPIPRSLFRKANVVLASAGSVIVGYKEGIPTIAIDSNDHEAIGIYGINTMNTLFRCQSDSSKTIKDYLYEILVDRKYGRQSPVPKAKLEYSKHQRIIDSNFNNNYYDVLKCKKMISHIILRKILYYISNYSLGKYIVEVIRSIRK